MGAVIEIDHMAIVTEFCMNGSVDDIIQHTRLTFEEKVKFVLDAALGMLYLHKMEIVHFDLKPSNLLVDDIGNVKVSGRNMWEGNKENDIVHFHLFLFLFHCQILV
jgi:serine/threonine protein kinase